MSSVAAKLSEADRRLLESACARNQSAELHYKIDDDLHRARMRLIGIEEAEVHVDQPSSIGADVRLEQGTPVTVYFICDNKHYAFRSAVLRRFDLFDLNHRRRVFGAALTLPDRVIEQQRRQDYRVPVAIHDIPVSLHELVSGSQLLTPRNARRFDGRIVNVSGGGLAVLVASLLRPEPSLWDPYFASFCLPYVPGAFGLAVLVRHVRRLEEREDTVLGLRFAGSSEPLVRAQLRRVEKFIAEEQRRQLRRARGTT